jgi:hypothetical protein
MLTLLRGATRRPPFCECRVYRARHRRDTRPPSASTGQWKPCQAGGTTQPAGRPTGRAYPVGTRCWGSACGTRRSNGRLSLRASAMVRAVGPRSWASKTQPSLRVRSAAGGDQRAACGARAGGRAPSPRWGQSRGRDGSHGGPGKLGFEDSAQPTLLRSCAPVGGKRAGGMVRAADAGGWASKTQPSLRATSWLLVTRETAGCAVGSAPAGGRCSPDTGV